MNASDKRQLIEFADTIEHIARNTPPLISAEDKWRFEMGNGTRYTIQCLANLDAVQAVANKIRKSARSRNIIFKT